MNLSVQCLKICQDWSLPHRVQSIHNSLSIRLLYVRYTDREKHMLKKSITIKYQHDWAQSFYKLYSFNSNSLKTNINLNYVKIQVVLRSKHSSARL